MLKKLRAISATKYYWLALAILFVGLEGAALFYQYVLNYGPCVLCIHVRIIVMGMLIVALVGLFIRRHPAALLGVSLVMTGLLAILFERSYQLLGVERGFITGSCGFDSGLPGWFAIDKWFPYMFKIWESCGYTPVLLFGITMAEALIVLSAVLLMPNILINIAVMTDQARK